VLFEKVSHHHIIPLLQWGNNDREGAVELRQDVMVTYHNHGRLLSPVTKGEKIVPISGLGYSVFIKNLSDYHYVRWGDVGDRLRVMHHVRKSAKCFYGFDARNGFVGKAAYGHYRTSGAFSGPVGATDRA